MSPPIPDAVEFEPWREVRVRPPQVADNEVHLWALPLDPRDSVVQTLEPLLAADEIERANRFRFPRHRRRFLVGRAFLRVLLARYRADAPERVRFVYGDKGKPALDPSQGAPLKANAPLSFNLSNSGDRAVIAVTRDQALGVDLEVLRPMPDAETIAERFFSRPERLALRAVPSTAKSEAFFRCWTRKEAYIKAVGDGLSMPLDRFDVSLNDDEPCRFLALDGSTERAEGWTLRHLEPGPGTVGALALEGRGWRVRAWRLEGHQLVDAD